MKIGLLAYSTDTGLGNQTWEFYKHLSPQTVLVADLSRFNMMPTHHERFPNARIYPGIPDNDAMEWLVNNSDVVFVAETPLNFHLFAYAKERNVPVIQQYNYEFLDYFEHPEWPKPAILAAPSSWNTEKVEALNAAPVIYTPVPVNTSLIPYRQMDKVETFVNIVGRPSAYDRNGTIEFLQAALLLGRKYKYLIYLQPPTDRRAVEYFQPVKEMIDAAKTQLDLEVVLNVENYADMYSRGEVLVMPRKYGGLCLPAQEALSAGMPVIMTATAPNFDYLPMNWLANCSNDGSFYAHVDINLNKANILSVADRMEYIAQSILSANPLARKIAEARSWETLTSWYMDFLAKVVNDHGKGR